jgi:predicted acetyltransferase
MALLSMLGGWASVAPTIGLSQPSPDPVALLTTSAGRGTVEQRQPWMLRVVDAPGAIAARGWSAHLRGGVGIEIEDVECPWNAGPWRLVLDAGEARLEPGGSGGATFSPRGLALWYAGAASPAVLRRAGLLTGDAGSDDLLQVATAGPTPALLDYF